MLLFAYVSQRSPTLSFTCDYSLTLSCTCDCSLTVSWSPSAIPLYCSTCSCDLFNCTFKSVVEMSSASCKHVIVNFTQYKQHLTYRQVILEPQTDLSIDLGGSIKTCMAGAIQSWLLRHVLMTTFLLRQISLVLVVFILFLHYIGSRKSSCHSQVEVRMEI